MTDVAALWTLPELTERVDAALAAEDGAIPSGRVRDVPDARTIRWYQTTGLVDRPEHRGRTAMYSERHLLQLIAIKRLQQQGLPLNEIQARLAGLDDDALAAIVGLEREPRPAASARRFWTQQPAPAPSPEPSRRTVVDVIWLRDDVRLLIDNATWHLSPHEEAAVLDAAAPLLSLLKRLDVIRTDTTAEAVRRPKEQA